MTRAVKLYEADRARVRYMRVDPNNRLVADTLEAQWNEKLRLLAQAKEDYETQRRQDSAQISSTNEAGTPVPAIPLLAEWFTVCAIPIG